MHTVYQMLLKPAGGYRYEETGAYPTRDAAASETPYPDIEGWKIGGDPEVRYLDALDGSWLITPVRVADNDADRVELASELAITYGTYDGEHHKMWVIDQMLRALAGDRYDGLLSDFRSGGDGPDTYEWDEGIAP